MSRLPSANGEISSKADTWNEIWELPLFSEEDPASEIAGKTLSELMSNPRIREIDVMRIFELLRSAVRYGERQAQNHESSSIAEGLKPYECNAPGCRNPTTRHICKECDIALGQEIEALKAAGYCAACEEYVADVAKCCVKTG